jgi:hypothetical protein
VKWLEDRKIFSRKRKSNETRALGMLLYYAGLSYTVVSFGPRSAIERLFSDIERRIIQFWNGFIGKYSRESMERWVKVFVGLRNCTKDLKRVLS